MSHQAELLESIPVTSVETLRPDCPECWEAAVRGTGGSRLNRPTQSLPGPEMPAAGSSPEAECEASMADT